MSYDIHIARELAQEFTLCLTQRLGREVIAAINERNDTEPSVRGVCRSHDFCDANQYMIDAFKQLLGREPALADEPENENDTDLMNSAWAIARNDRYQLTPVPVTFAFADLGPFEGMTDGTTWNGWLNVWVTPEVHAEVIEALNTDEPGSDGDINELTPCESGWMTGLISYANGYCATRWENNDGN